MELTILLAKIFGVYMLLIGVAIFMNRKHFLGAIIAIAKERFAQIIAGAMALLIGLWMINVHNDWSSGPAGLITLIGWIGLAKGVLYLFLPEAQLAKITHVFAERTWYMVDGVIVIVLGAYLAGYGYGLW